ncbi:diguanylate cyclase [Halomonas sp. 18H]|nr:diguanylate cyclase [Halomonas sp. 18H]MCW4149272.1 diguanylate cyclase [Halomonas sp. 18H]
MTMEENPGGGSWVLPERLLSVDSICPSLLTQIFDNFTEAVVVADVHRRIIYVNQAMEALFGYAQQELLGRETSILYADQEDFRELGRKRFNIDSQVATESYRVAYRRWGGERFLGLTTGAVMRSRNGGPAGFIGIIRPARSSDTSLETLQKVHTITSDFILTHGQKIASLLRIGMQHFGFEIAILSRVVGNDYIVEYCVDYKNEIKPSACFELSGTYCERTLELNKTLGFCYVGKSELQRHPCYLNTQLESYIGSPVCFNGENYGTLNFSSHSPTEPFSRDDYIFMRLLADTISYLLYKKMFEEEMLAQAKTDELTGLPNRRAVCERLNDTLDIASRSGFYLTVLSLDLDHFKTINDRWGHSAGDAALMAFAGLVGRLGRRTDFCGRLGGDEFLFVLPGASLEDAKTLGNQLRHRLSEIVVELKGGDTFSFSVSLGVAMHHPGESAQTLLQRADEALYRAKQGGRDRLCE